MHIDVSAIIPLRNAEPFVARLVRETFTLLGELGAPDDGDRPLSFEIVVLDQSSVDNTLSVLSVLHHQVEPLRTLQDLEAGTAIARARTVARGDAWVLLDRPVDPDLVRWSLAQVFGERRAAIVPGEVLAVRRDVGMAALAGLDGGLVTAQRAVVRHLRRAGDREARCPAPDRGMVDRAFTYVRGGLGKVGLGWLDRPLPGNGNGNDSR